MSTLKIFNTKITPDRNALIENIGAYLSSLNATYDSSEPDIETGLVKEFQYIQIAPKLNVKVNLNQAKVGSRIGNYVQLIQDYKNYYFFILKANWKAKNTVELELALDTVNTFAGDFTFTDKTNVVREHKDRFAKRVKNREKRKLVYAGIRAEADIALDEPNGKIAIESVSGSVVVTGRLTIQSYSYDEETNSVHVVYTLSGAGFGTILVSYTDNVTVPVIDKQSEGIDAILYGTQTGEVTNKDKDNLDWYLIYNSSTESGGTTSLPTMNIMPSEEFRVATATSSTESDGTWKFTPDDLEEGYWYWIDFQTDSSISWNWDGGFYKRKIMSNVPANVRQDQIYFAGYAGWETFKGNRAYCLAFKKTDDGKIEVRNYDYKHPLDHWEFDKLYGTTVTEELILTNKAQSFTAYKSRNVPNGDNRMTMNSGEAGLAVEKLYFEADPADSVKTLSPYYKFDNTREDLIKVIKLPYCPLSYSYDTISGIVAAKFDVPTTVVEIEESATTYDFSYLRLNRLTSTETPFNYIINTDIENPLHKLVEHVELPESDHALRSVRDPKLMHSDYYQPKFIYDSFEFPMQLERVDRNIDQPEYLRTQYVVSSVISSRFMFVFPDYVCTENESAYYNQLIVNRNNEMPLYNSAYINYLRTGYNYDVKAKDLSVTGTWIGAGIGVATTVAGIVVAATGAGAPLGAGLIVSGVATTASTVSSGIISTQNAENSLAQKKASLSARGTSVSTCDDIDLTSVYTNNKAKTMLYEPSRQMKKLLDDAFYYTGYISNVRKVPTTHTRRWFDFLSCEAVFNEEILSPYAAYLDDIKSRYALGVTIYHDVNGEWDLDQHYENMELSLIAE